MKMSRSRRYPCRAIAVVTLNIADLEHVPRADRFTVILQREVHLHEVSAFQNGNGEISVGL